MQDVRPQKKQNAAKNGVPATKADSPSNAVYPDLWGASAQVPGHAHRERVFNLAFDASRNKWMASASEANEVKIWNVADTGIAPILSKTLSHKAEVLRVAWGQHQGKGAGGADPKDPHSSWLATGSAAGGVRIYFVSSEQESDEEERGNSRAPASASTTATLVTEFAHPEEGQQVYALQWVDDDIDERGNTNRLLLTAADDMVYFWDVETQSMTTKWSFEQLPPAQDKEESSSAVYGGTNRNPGGMCYVFDATVGRLYPGQSSDVVCLALSDGSVRVLDRRAGEAVATVRGMNGSHLTALCLSTEEGMLLACGGGGDVVAYDTRTFSVRAVLEGYGRPVFGAAVVPRELAKEHVLTDRRKEEGPVVMTWSTDTCLRFYELGVDQAMIRHVVQHQNFPIYTAAFSQGQGRRLVLGGGGGMPEPQNTHSHEHKHEEMEGEGEGGGGGGTFCSHGTEDEHHHHHHHHHNNADETVVPPSILSYQFSK